LAFGLGNGGRSLTASHHHCHGRVFFTGIDGSIAQGVQVSASKQPAVSTAVSAIVMPGIERTRPGVCGGLADVVSGVEACFEVATFAILDTRLHFRGSSEGH